MTIALATALVTLDPAVQTLESRLLPSLGRLLSNICTLTAAFGLLHLMLYVTTPVDQVPRRARNRLIVLLIAVGLMAAMFAASKPHTGTGIFTGLYRSQPTLAVYILDYTLYLTVAVADLASLSLRSIRYTRSWLRAGMVLIAVGCVMAFGYLGQKISSIVVELVTGAAAEPYCHSPFETLNCTFAVGFPPLIILMTIIGATLPSLGPHLERPVRAFADKRSYQRLTPLWETLHSAFPDLAFTPASPPHETMSEQLYRRVVAVRDGLLILQPYRSAEDTSTHDDQAQDMGITNERRRAAVEAADIRTALYRRQHETPPTDAETAIGPQHDDLTSEIRWLTRVSDALARGELHPVEPADADQ